MIMVTNITLERLEEQVRWHSHNAKWNQDRYKWLKGVEFIAAALVPFFAGWGAYPIVTGLLAVAVVVLEAIQSIYPVSYTHLDVYKRQVSGSCRMMAIRISLPR